MNVEMQAWKRPAQRERALYNWSRQFGMELRRGDGYDKLKPFVVVFVFAYPELPGERFHSTFRVLEMLHPPSPIRYVTVQNPELPREEVDDKGVTLDVLTELESGAQVNVEMQAWKRPAQRERALYNWSRQFGMELRRGDGYDKLKPFVVVFVFAYPELPGERFHSTFRVLEIHDGTLLSDVLEIHAVELPKLRPGTDRDPEDAALRHWGRFLAASTDAERTEAAMSNSDIRKANEALERLSLDPAVREMARRREEALLLYRMELGEARREGQQEGLREGKQEGLREGLREGKQEGLREGKQKVIEAMCNALGISLDERCRARLRTMSTAELDDLAPALALHRQWPDD